MLVPLEPKQWDLTKAAHLLNRAGFGGSPAEIKAFCALGLDGAVKAVLDAPEDAAEFPKPEWAEPRDMQAVRQGARGLPQEERKARFKMVQREDGQNGADLVAWWLDRMARSPNPYREKMTLFWHGHFATSLQKVKQPYLMWKQNALLRANAFGHFGTMVKAISRDPAMMVWLDTRNSRKEAPNENFARELMELFTLGIGNYTEEDVKAAARAFTGFRINQQDESFTFARFQHDFGEKEFFGKKGAFGGDEIVDLILEKPACAQFIGKKIWEFFAFDEPKQAIVDTVANSFRGHKWEIKPVMNEIFRSAEFYSPAAIRTQIKSPVQWLIGTIKVLEVEMPQRMVVTNLLRQLGQMPFAPPSVKGWDGGKSWITTSTLLLRYNLANFAIGNGSINVAPMRKIAANEKKSRPGIEMRNRAPLDLQKIAPAELRGEPERLVAYVTFRLFQTALSARETESFVNYVEQRKEHLSDNTLRELLHLMMSTPQYQLT